MTGTEYGANWDWGEGERPSAGGGERSSQVKVGIGLVGVKFSMALVGEGIKVRWGYSRS